MPYTSVMLFWFELQVSLAVLISRGFFSSPNSFIYSSDLAMMAVSMGDLDMTGLSKAIRRWWSIWFSAISFLAMWRL